MYGKSKLFFASHITHTNLIFTDIRDLLIGSFYVGSTAYHQYLTDFDSSYFSKSGISSDSSNANISNNYITINTIITILKIIKIK